MKIYPNLGEVNLEFLGCRGSLVVPWILVRKTYGSRKPTNAMLEVFAMLGLLYSSNPPTQDCP